MGQNSKIEWTDATWNPVVGCTPISPGCKNCYAKELHDMRHEAHGRGIILSRLPSPESPSSPPRRGYRRDPSSSEAMHGDQRGPVACRRWLR